MRPVSFIIIPLNKFNAKLKKNIHKSLYEKKNIIYMFDARSHILNLYCLYIREQQNPSKLSIHRIQIHPIQIHGIQIHGIQIHGIQIQSIQIHPSIFFIWRSIQSIQIHPIHPIHPWNPWDPKSQIIMVNWSGVTEVTEQAGRKKSKISNSGLNRIKYVKFMLDDLVILFF